MAVAHSVDKPRIQPGALAAFIDVQNEVDWAYYVGAQGRAGGRRKVTFGGRAMEGKSSSYELHIPLAAYRQLRARRLPLPDPFDPRTLPLHASVLLKDSDFKETGLSLAYRAIAIELTGRVADGMAIGLTKIAKDRVQAIVGPIHGVKRNVFAGLALDFEIVGVMIGGGTVTEKERYRLKTAVFDLATEKGRTAFTYFLLSGRLRELADGPGIEQVGTILKMEMSRQQYSAVAVELGGLALKVGSVGSVVSGEMQQTRYDSGLLELVKTLRYDDKVIALRSVKRHGKLLDSRYRVVLPGTVQDGVARGVESTSAVRFASLARETQWRPRARAKRYVLQFTFAPEDIQGLRRGARRCLADRECLERVRDYYESMPAFVREHPQSAYPGQLAIVAMKAKILRHWANPESTAFDDFAPCRELIPFLAMEPWIVESTLSMLRPKAGAEPGREPIAKLLLVVPRGETPVYDRPG